MMTADRFFEEGVLGVLVEIPTEASTVARAERLLEAMTLLREAGLALVLVPNASRVSWKPRRRRRWRRERKEKR